MSRQPSPGRFSRTALPWTGIASVFFIIDKASEAAKQHRRRCTSLREHALRALGPRSKLVDAMLAGRVRDICVIGCGSCSAIAELRLSCPMDARGELGSPGRPSRESHRFC